MGKTNAKKSMAGLEFVKQVLPAELHRYAHLIPLVVNDHVSWLEPEAKQYALTVGLVAFDKALKKRREGATEGEFCEYAKQCIWGAIRNEFKSEIEGRQFWAGNPSQAPASITCDEDTLDMLEYDASRRYGDDNGYGGFDEEDRYDDLLYDDEYGEFDYSPSWEQTGPGGLKPGDSLYLPAIHGDDEYTELARLLLGPPDRGDLTELLPERERLLLRQIEEGRPVAELCQMWSITPARGSQLVKQARQRLAGYKERYDAGERFSVLTEEIRQANRTAMKKQAGCRSARARRPDKAARPTP